MGFLYLFYFCISTLVLSEYESCKDNIESYCPYIIAEQGPKYIRKFLFPFFHHIVLPYILSVFLHLRRPSLTSLKFLPFYSLRFFTFQNLQNHPFSALFSTLNVQSPKKGVISCCNFANFHAIVEMSASMILVLFNTHVNYTSTANIGQQ